MSIKKRISRDDAFQPRMDFDLVIRNATLVTCSETFPADIGVRAGKIAAIAQGLAGDQVVDANGCYVLPGAVDPHVHLEMPTAETTSSDTWATGTRAAACGGTTTVIDFVEPESDENLLKAYEKRRTQAENQAQIDFGLHMTLTNAKPQTLAHVPEVVAAGMPSFKMYTTYEGLKLDDKAYLKCCQAIRDAKGMALAHCENDAVVGAATAETVKRGITGPEGHPLARPAIAEVESITRILKLSRFARIPIYIVHISTVRGAEALKKARRNGLSAYGETCPQYLLLTDEKYSRPNFEAAKFVCSPPLRKSRDNFALWKALARGDLQTVGTDHCPFNFKGQKEIGRDDFTKIPGGLPGIQSRLALLYSFGVRKGHLSLNRWVEACCTAPAKIFGLYPQKGALIPGADADFVLFDPHKEIPIRQDWLSENVDYTPYEGIKLQGMPVKTYLRGQLVAEHGEYVGEGIAGQFIKREMHG